MTTHNSSTISIIDGKCLFTFFRNEQDSISCEIDSKKRKAFELLASSTVQTIEFFEDKNLAQIEETMEKLDNLIKDTAITGKYVEYAFKKLTTIMDENVNPHFFNILKKITGIKYKKENINIITTLKKDFYELLNDDFKKNKLNIYWDQIDKENQAAWDLLILDNLNESSKIYLIQVYYGGQTLVKIDNKKDKIQEKIVGTNLKKNNKKQSKQISNKEINKKDEITETKETNLKIQEKIVKTLETHQQKIKDKKDKTTKTDDNSINLKDATKILIHGNNEYNEKEYKSFKILKFRDVVEKNKYFQKFCANKFISHECKNQQSNVEQ